MPVPLAPSTANMYSGPRMAMQYYDTTGASPYQLHSQQQQHHSQQQQQQPYDYAGPGPVSVGPVQQSNHRASSGAWTNQDDQSLLEARASGLNWGQIHTKHFPAKTPNACRKRHERLMDRKNQDGWGQRKMEILAREYVNKRKEIWAPLAQATGEKWATVEKYCLGSGLKNLQSAARAASRRERLNPGEPLTTGYDDDSGVDGIGLTPVDDIDAPYSSPEGSNGSHGGHSSSGGSSTATGYQMGGHHAQLHALGHHHSAPPAAYTYASQPGHSYNSSMSSNGTNPAYAPSQHSANSSPYMNHHPSVRGQRMPSADMGIEAIIHRPGQAS